MLIIYKRIHATSWGCFPVITVQHPSTGIARTYYAGYYNGHPRWWVALVARDSLRGEFGIL